MASRPSGNKRRKEMARREKQLAKAQRKLQRKLEKDQGGVDPSLELLDADAETGTAEPGAEAEDDREAEPDSSSPAHN